MGHKYFSSDSVKILNMQQHPYLVLMCATKDILQAWERNIGEGNNSLFSLAYFRKNYRRKFNFSVVTWYLKVCCVFSMVSWKKGEVSIESFGSKMPMYIGWDTDLLPFTATISVEILWMEGVDHHFMDIKNICNSVQTETDIKLLTENSIKNGYISS